MDIVKAKELDAADPLRGFRSKFYQSDDDLIYLDGNSLGRLPLASQDLISNVVANQWGNKLIRSWNSDWIGINQQLGAKIADLIGAKPNEVILTDSTSLNLFKLAYGALKMQGQWKSRIVSDDLNFPSDLYILQGLIDMFGDRHQLILAKSEDGISTKISELKEVIDHRTALLTLSYVCFKSAFKYDMHELTSFAQEQGALVLWDLSHAVGAIPIDLNECNVDMAIGCTYKYLNGGPGSLAFLYVREDLQNKLTNPIWGWFSDARPFDFDLEFKPASGIQRFQTSTTPILSASAVEPGLDVTLEAGINEIASKSKKTTEYLIELFDQFLSPIGFTLGSPREASDRGSHVSIRHPEGYRISHAMINPQQGAPVIIPDFREPDYIRLGIAPLYTSFEDIFRSVMRMKEIVDNEEFLNHSSIRPKVT